MNVDQLKGCATALLTPFRSGEVDYDAYRKMVERQVEGGVDFLVALGSTAETPCLTNEEKVALLDITITEAKGMPVVAGVGTNSLIHTIANIKLLDKADAYLVVVPYYNKPNQQGIYEYFKAVAESTDKPILLYNVPGRTAANMSSQTVIKLSSIPNIVGIKEASGNLKQIADIAFGTDDDFIVLSGNDDQTLDVITAGGHGVISVASNIAPRMMSDMTRYALRGDEPKAVRIFSSLLPLFDACFVESNPIPAKAAMEILGLCKNEMRLPLVECEPSTYRLMTNVIKKLNFRHYGQA